MANHRVYLEQKKEEKYELWERMLALSLAKECYVMKLDLLYSTTSWTLRIGILIEVLVE